MKTLLFVILAAACTGCSMRDYDLAAVSQSFVSSTQNEHIARLQAESKRTGVLEQYARVCAYYPEGYGGYSAGCQ